MLTIKPIDYARIAHKHNQVALTLKAIGKSADAEHHARKRDVAMQRGRSAQAVLKEKAVS